MVLACVVYKAFVCTIMIPSCLYLVCLPLLSESSKNRSSVYSLGGHSVHLVSALFDTLHNTIFNSYFNRVHACKP